MNDRRSVAEPSSPSVDIPHNALAKIPGALSSGNAEREMTGPVTAKRRAWVPRYRDPVYVGEPGRLVTADELERACERGGTVYVVGPAPNAAQLAELARALGPASERAAGWRVTYFADGHSPAMVVGRARVSWASAWWGDGVNVEQSRWLFAWLREALEDVAGHPVAIYPTPATTGRDLWLRTIPAGQEWPAMAEPWQRFVRSVSGQGRIETMPAPHGEPFPLRVLEYDARLAYLANVDNLPIGNPEPLERVPDDPYAVGLAHGTFTIPDGWNLPGILPLKSDGGAWEWPAAPGTYGPGWVTMLERFVALRSGWRFTPTRCPETGLEALTWAVTGSPLRRWRRLVLEALERSQGRLTTLEARARMRAGLRIMALSTIGAFHGSPRRVTRYGESPPDHAESIRLLPDGMFQWAETEPPAWPECVHPEWSALIWARARVRLLTSPRGVGILHLPPGSVVAVRTDAIYTTEPVPDDLLPLEPAPGEYVRKREFAAPRWPRNGAELLRMREVEA